MCPVCITASPAVALATLAGGEIALLKAMRQLRRLARATVWSALFTLAVSVWLYAAMGISGVVPVLVCGSAGLFVFNLREAARSHAYRIALPDRRTLRAGERRRFV